MTAPDQRQIVFLMYENRSGSTYLAAQLDRFDQIGVTIETETFADLLEGTHTISDEADLEKILKTLFAEKKFQEWNVDPAALRTALAALPRPAGFEAILRAILEVFFDHQPLPYYLVKGTRLTHHIARLRKEVPSARYLHILRDPRAVFGSQKSSKKSDGAIAMSDDPYDSAARWAINATRVDNVAGPDLHEVLYEDLIRDFDNTIDGINTFMQRPDLPQIRNDADDETQGDAYLAKIPEDQRHLHQNLVKRPRTDRIEAWRNELSDVEIVLTQRAAGTVMQAKGYDLDQEVESRVGSLSLALSRSRLFIATLMRRIRNAIRYAAEGKLLWKLKAVFHRARV